MIIQYIIFFICFFLYIIIIIERNTEISLLGIADKNFVVKTQP